VQPVEIVYVSCDPVTLGRDLQVMVDSGYRLHELHMVDMFPQTFHQETVAVMRR
jgi:23S rRNA (uracil1939-C5)-methyltransferase